MKLLLILLLVTSLYSKDILTVSYTDVKHYLFDNYPNLSRHHKNIIFDEVTLAAKKYKVNPIWIFAILDTESTYRSWITHSRVRVKVYDKYVTTHAIGMGGIIYELWAKELKREKIVAVKNDLYDPRNNIRATTYIFAQLLKQKKLTSCKTHAESALLRYYGVKYSGKKLDKFYYTKINSYLAAVSRYSIKD